MPDVPACRRVFLMCCLASVGGCAQVEEAAPPVKVAPVGIAAVVERDIVVGRTLVGSVVPVRSSVVGSAMDGRVEKFLINEGDWISKGAVLAELRKDTVLIELSAAEQELDLRRHELEELNNGARPEEKDRAQAELAGAKALMDYAQLKRERAERLYKQGRAISDEDLQEARSQAAQTKQAYLASRAARALTEKGPRQEKIDQAQARMSHQEKLRDAISDRLEKHSILTPFDGHVVAEHTEEGEWLSQGDPVAEIVQLDSVDVQVFLPELYVTELGVGTQAEVTFDALPGRTFGGQVVIVVPQADVRSRSFPIKIRLENPNLVAGNGRSHIIKAGMLATVKLMVADTQRVLLVPKDALVLGESRPYVFVFQPDPSDDQVGQVRRVPVTTEPDLAEDSLVSVKGPLRAGDFVVVRGNERLQPNQQVRIDGIGV